MHHIRTQRVLSLVGFLALLCAPLMASIPQFSAKTMDGELITSDSLRGKVVLVQFWTTWCPWCRRDQPIVDDLESRYADKDLVVLAVNVGEPEDLVRAYLSQRPRSCRVVLNSSVNLASRLGAHGYPTYVVIDAQGRVVANQSGSGGESSLLRMLAKAGLPSRPSGSTMIATSEPSHDRSRPLMISIPSGPVVPPAKPRQKTVFLLANGERLESDDYTIDSTAVTVTVEGRKRVIPLKALNVNATKAANKERGINLAIPDSPNQLVLSF